MSASKIVSYLAKLFTIVEGESTLTREELKVADSFKLILQELEYSQLDVEEDRLLDLMADLEVDDALVEEYSTGSSDDEVDEPVGKKIRFESN